MSLLYIYSQSMSFYEARYVWNKHLLVNTNIDVELVTQCANSLRFGDSINSVQEHIFVVQCFCIIFTLCLVWCINSDYLKPTLITSKTFLFLPFSKCNCKTWLEKHYFRCLEGNFCSLPPAWPRDLFSHIVILSVPLSRSCSSDIHSKLTLQPSVASCVTLPISPL